MRLVELYKHAGIFKNTREVLLRTSLVFLKIPACLYNSTMQEEQVFYFFNKAQNKRKLTPSSAEMTDKFPKFS